MAENRLETLNNKLADQLSRGMGFAGGAYKIGRRLKLVGLTSGADPQPFLVLGTSSSPLPLATYANRGFSLYVTSASTDADNSAEAMYVKSVMTGIGGVGGRARFHLYTNVALGGWCNAVKAFMEFGSAGRITGLASCFCADLELSVGTTQGAYTAFEANIIADASVSTGTATSFMRCNIDGTSTPGKQAINANAHFLEFGEGIEMGSSDDTAIITTIHSASTQTHQVSMRAPDGTRMWLMATTETPSGN